MDNLELGDKIRELRKAKKLTQKELGKLIEKAESTVRMWELGKSTPPPETIQKLSKALDVDFLKLMVTAGYLDEEDVTTSEGEEKVFEYAFYIQTLDELKRINKLIIEHPQDEELKLQQMQLEARITNHERINGLNEEKINLEEILTNNTSVYLNNKFLSKPEKEKALQILKLAFDTTQD